MRLVILLFLLLWLLASILYMVNPKYLWKFRMTLHRLGWLNRWSMFIPNKTNEGVSFKLLFRDKGEDGTISEWKRISQGQWYPLRFLFNIRIRMYHIVVHCVKELIKEQRKGKEDLTHDDHFLYLVQIIYSYPNNKSAVARQIKLAYSDNERQEEKSLAETEFLAIK